ncbi:MAG: hypothetical protein ACE5D6_09775 [Candidatus Zixiibacteriota bacterium]
MSHKKDTYSKGILEDSSYESRTVDELMPPPTEVSSRLSAKDIYIRRPLSIESRDIKTSDYLKFSININRELKRQSIAYLNKRLKKIERR